MEISKEVVYTGGISQIRRSNEPDQSNVPVSLIFSQDDVLIMGPFEVQILGLRCATSNQNIIAGNKSSTIKHRCLDDDVVQVPQKIQKVCGTKRILSAPLQSKHSVCHELKQQGKIIGVANVNKVQQLRNPSQNTIRESIGLRTTTSTFKQPLRSSSLPSNNFVKKSIPSRSMPLQGELKQQLTALDLTLQNLCHNNIETKVLPHIPLPASIRNVLRPHQIEGVDFIWRTLKEKKGCILGDEMGLGVCLYLLYFFGFRLLS
jgi:hypothetical protein